MPDRPAHPHQPRWRRRIPVLGNLLLLLVLISASIVPITLATTSRSGSGATSSLNCPRIIAPIYTTETSVWEAALDSDMPEGSILILNVGATRAGDDPWQSKGGPGRQANPQMQEYVRQAQERGFSVIGYIRTGETGSNDGPRRDRAWTDREIQDLTDWYDVDGIFYDEVYSDAEYYTYYADLVAHGRETVPGLHVLNVGGHPSELYANLGDVIGIFEGTADDFLVWSPELDPDEYAPQRWAAAVMSVADADHMREIIDHARAQKLGYVYATNTFGTSTQNPWATLPPYWDDQLTTLKRCS